MGFHRPKKGNDDWNMSKELPGWTMGVISHHIQIQIEGFAIYRCCANQISKLLIMALMGSENNIL